MLWHRRLLLTLYPYLLQSTSRQRLPYNNEEYDMATNDFKPTSVSIRNVWQRAEALVAAQQAFDSEVFECRAAIARDRDDANFASELAAWNQVCYTRTLQADANSTDLTALAERIRTLRAEAAHHDLRADNLEAALAACLTQMPTNG